MGTTPGGVTAEEEVAAAEVAAATGEELPDLEGFSEEDTARIIKLQATSRGHLARKAMKAPKTMEEAHAAIDEGVELDLPRGALEVHADRDLTPIRPPRGRVDVEGQVVGDRTHRRRESMPIRLRGGGPQCSVSRVRRGGALPRAAS